MNPSRITLGTAQLGMKYGIANRSGRPSFDEAKKILHFAVENGVNSLDTAPVYGESEDVIGEFLESENLESQILITTKLPSLTSRKVELSSVPQVVSVELERSLRRLKVDSVWNYLVHDYRDVENYGEVLVESLSEHRASGRVKHIGVSVYTPEEAEVVLTFPSFDTIQFPFNLFDHRFARSGVLEKLKKKGFTTFARSAFLQGLFFLNPEELPLALSKVHEHLINLRKMAVETGLSVEELALGYLKEQKSIDSVVIGVDTLEQLERNLTIFNRVSLSDQVIKKVEDLFSDIEEDIIDPRRWR
ncbi:MAG: hypothetical protein PWP37_1484 [Thermotogota bacterium]|nr:hypothetical protein [Thermotogota bacterium]MDK2865292.1 hypothetical protein [Thermotogota bacterium]HCZ07415.1 aldo/keto reductase [Thermotogota bacterium]